MYEAVAQEIDERFDEEARFAAPIGWHLNVYLERPVYSLLFAAQKKSDRGIDQVIADRNIDAVLLIPSEGKWEAEYIGRYLEERYGPGEDLGKHLGRSGPKHPLVAEKTKDLGLVFIGCVQVS